MKRHAVQWDARIGRRLRLRDLHILFAVVQCKSMAKAAADLGISQPSVSQAMAELEHTVGVQLLSRSPQGVEPTLYGEALLHRSRAAFDELRQGIRDVEFLADPGAGEVGIACPESLTAGFLPAVIERISRLYPRMVFGVIQSNASKVLQDLRERKVDLALVRLSRPIEESDLVSESLFDDPIFVVAGAQNPLTRRRKITLAELSNEPWIAIPADNPASSFVAQAFHAAGLSLPAPVVVTFSQHLRFHLLAGGRYLTILPGSVMQFNRDHFGLKNLPIDLRVQPRPVAVVTLKHRLLGPAASLFIACAREVAKLLMKTNKV